MVLLALQFLAMLVASMLRVLTGAVVTATWAGWRGSPLPTNLGWRRLALVGLKFWLGTSFAVYLAIGFYNLLFGSALEP